MIVPAILVGKGSPDEPGGRVHPGVQRGRYLSPPAHRLGRPAIVRAHRVDRGADRHVRDRLIDYGQLRNVIIQSDAYPEETIAEPNEETVQEFSRIVSLVMSPPRLNPTFQQAVQCFAPDDPAIQALAFMHGHDYSQVVIQAANGLQVLTVRASPAGSDSRPMGTASGWKRRR